MAVTLWSNQTLERRETSIPSNYLAANQTFAHSAKDVGLSQVVHGVYLRILFDLTTAAPSTTTIGFADEDARQNLLTALISQIQITGTAAGVKGDIVQRMALGEHYQALRGLGILPVCPDLFEAGFGNLPLAPRSGAPTPSQPSTFVELLYPIVAADCGPEFGSVFCLGSEQLRGMSFSITFGSFAFTDSNGVAWTIAGGTGATGAKIDAEIMYRYRTLPQGAQFLGNPIRFARTQNTDSERINLTSAGVTLSHTVRLNSVAGTYNDTDSAANLLRGTVYATGATLTNADIYRIEQYAGGEDQPDAIFRRLPDMAYEDAFRSPGLEIDQDQYARSASSDPTTRFWQGGLRMVSLRGKRPINGVLVGPYDVRVPPQWSSSLIRTHLYAFVAPRGFTANGASAAESAQGLVYAPRMVEDSIRELAGVVVTWAI